MASIIHFQVIYRRRDGSLDIGVLFRDAGKILENFKKVGGIIIMMCMYIYVRINFS